MPRTPEQNQNIKDRRRSKLLAFALKAFAINGYDHTAIDDITKPAKCSHGLFYHYFDSKEDVFSALIKEVLCGELEVPVSAALEQGSVAGLRLLCAYAAKVAKAGGKELCVAKITLLLPESKGLDDAAKAFARSHDIEKALVALIRQGQDEGKVIVGDAKLIARAFLDLAKGALSRLGNAGSEHSGADVLYGMFLKTSIAE